VVANESKKTTEPKNHDETDVAAALSRKTQDGKGVEPVPPSNFESFATEGVEKSNLLSVEEVTRQVLGGRWGATAAQAMSRLGEAGYDVDAVWAQFQKRKAGGAPSAF
jgi:hypothetical protein